MTRLGAVLAAAMLVAACSTEPPPTGPGTADLLIQGRYSECRSIGGCEYSARLGGPGMMVESTFGFGPAEGTLAIGPEMPLEIRDGSYTFTITSKLMSDVISNAEPREFFLDATCVKPFVVGPGRSTVTVRVVFSPQRCSIDLASVAS